MKRLFSFLLALIVLFGVNQGISYAGVQVDAGQTHGQADAVSMFFVARNGRVAGISADRVVILDANSNDGVSVTRTTLSYDRLSVGVTIDDIPGITSDETAASGLNQSNWGRVRVYGRHASVSLDSGSTVCVSGDAVGTHREAGSITASGVS